MELLEIKEVLALSPLLARAVWDETPRDLLKTQ
jgi:hypothetical protein